MINLLQQYKKTVPVIQEKFKIKNPMAVPKLEKVIINVGIGKLSKEEKTIERMKQDLAVLSGQKPSVRKAKKSIAGFKLREGMPVGLSVTLRGRRMYDFLDRFINIALPRSRDFRGIDPKNFDKMGNLNVGVKEYGIFPEVHYENIKDIFGLEITVVTNAKNKEMGMEFLKLMKFPIKK